MHNFHVIVATLFSAALVAAIAYDVVGFVVATVAVLGKGNKDVDEPDRIVADRACLLACLLPQYSLQCDEPFD